jgi:predicted acetyltransferase
MLMLAEPDMRFERAYHDMMAEWAATGEKPMPWPLQEDASDFAALLERLRGASRGEDVPKGYAPSSTWYAVDDETGVMVGAVNIRHWLAADMGYWGHIGFGVRPSLRRQGHASAMLAMALEKCAEMGMSQALAACYKDNTGSAKTILKNGGVLKRELPDPRNGRIIQQYWINIARG